MYITSNNALCLNSCIKIFTTGFYISLLHEFTESCSKTIYEFAQTTNTTSGKYTYWNCCISKNTCNFNHHRNAFKANVLLLLLSSLVTHKIFSMQH